MIRSLAITSFICASTICPMRAAAESTMPMPPMPPLHAMSMRMPQQISVAASGTADYVPDTANFLMSTGSLNPTQEVRKGNVFVNIGTTANPAAT